MADKRTPRPANNSADQPDTQPSTLVFQTYKQVRSNGLQRWFDEKAESRDLNQLYKWANPSMLEDER